MTRHDKEISEQTVAPGNEWAEDHGLSHKEKQDEIDFHYSKRDAAEDVGRIGRAHDQTVREGLSPVKKEEKQRKEDVAHLRRQREMDAWQERMDGLFKDLKKDIEEYNAMKLEAEENERKIQQSIQRLNENDVDGMRKDLVDEYGKDANDVKDMTDGQVRTETVKMTVETIDAQKLLTERMKVKADEIQVKIDNIREHSKNASEAEKLKIEQQIKDILKSGGQDLKALEQEFKDVEDADFGEARTTLQVESEDKYELLKEVGDRQRREPAVKFHTSGAADPFSSEATASASFALQDNAQNPFETGAPQRGSTVAGSNQPVSVASAYVANPFEASAGTIKETFNASADGSAVAAIQNSPEATPEVGVTKINSNPIPNPFT